MQIVMFYHSLLSCWNHGNAHFLRGMVSELLARGHQVTVYEPEDGWSRSNLLAEGVQTYQAEFERFYPELKAVCRLYDPLALDLKAALKDADLALVHEWNDHQLVARLGEYRKRHGAPCLLFHDTHHRAVTDAEAMAAYDLQHYDGVLAFGKVIQDLYLERGWTRRAWTWHEAADTRVFRPHPEPDPCEGDVVWIGNWGDEERTAELHEFLLEPVRELGLKARVYGVRYPDSARKALEDAGIAYGGWLPNYHAPEVFSRFRFTVHVPRRPYARVLPGIPTIRVFEALACGIPLITAPWEDAEHLFTPGRDFLVARDGEEMKRQMRTLLEHPERGRLIAGEGLLKIRERHTCVHRANQLLEIYREARA